MISDIDSNQDNNPDLQLEREPVPTRKPPRKLLLRILIPILIIAIAAGIYFYKNPISGDDTSTDFGLDATEDFNLDKILSHDLPVIIDFGSDSCIPCQEMAPVLAELNKELRGKAVVKFVDVWKNQEAAQNLPLEVIPTQFFFMADGSPYVPADPEAAAQQGFIMYTMKTTGEHVYTVHQGGLDKETIMAVLKEMGMK
jgi:thioredoxin 1